jgi:hypothetical protein
MPGDTLLILGTGHDLPLPVHPKLRNIESVWGACLPTGIYMHWPKEVNAVLVTTLQDALGADIAGINQVFFRRQLLVR